VLKALLLFAEFDKELFWIVRGIVCGGQFLEHLCQISSEFCVP